jgi:hypothetical protein
LAGLLLAAWEDAVTPWVCGAHLWGCQGDLLSAADLALVSAAEAWPLSDADGRAPAQVWQPEGGSAVSAVHGAEQGEQRAVLRDRQQLTLTLRPPLGCEVEAEVTNFAEKGLGHGHRS